MSQNTTYNGWANYETWAVALWMDNDPPAYDYWIDAAREANDANALADQMRSEYTEMMPELHGLWCDLLTSAIQEVDWYEIAESKIADVMDDEWQT